MNLTRVGTNLFFIAATGPGGAYALWRSNGTSDGSVAIAQLGFEAEADRQILELYREAYANETDPIRYLVKMDLFEILEKAIDRCRDAGNVIYHIALKNS